MRLYLELIKVHIKSAIQYKLSFFTEVLGVLLGYIGNMVIYYIMFRNFNELNGWTFWETMFVYTYAMVCMNTSNVFFSHFCLVDSEIINGSFDKYLLRPIGNFKYYFMSKINVSQFSTLPVSIVLFVMVSMKANIEINVFNIFIMVVSMLGSVLVNSGCLVLVGAVAFWTKKSQELYDSILWPAQYLTFLPLTIFPAIIKVSFTYILPLAFISYYPASIFLKRNSGAGIVSYYGYLTCLVGAVFFLITYWIWTRGIKHYEGSGS